MIRLTGTILFLVAITGISAQTLTDPNLVVSTFATGFSSPTSMVFLQQGEQLVAEKNTGRVRYVQNGVIVSTALDLAVNTQSERGLLGMQKSPLFSTDSQIYLFYTASTSGADTSAAQDPLNNRVSRFTWNGSALINEQVLLNISAIPGPNHDGGIIVFGPPNASPSDQKLYIVVGDLNRNNKNENFATGADSDDSACVIRINRDGTTPSGTDKGPFFDVVGANASLRRMYSYGIRNSYGMTFDPVTNVLWTSENGTGDYDEINRVPAAHNGGWEDLQGPDGGPSTDESAPGRIQFGGIGTYSDPEFSWRQIVAPTAIHFNTGALLGAAYLNDCFVGCNNNGKLYHFEVNPARTGFVLSGSLADLVLDTGLGDTDTQIVAGTGFSVVTDIENGPDGALYVLCYGPGTIFRIHSPGAAVIDWTIYE